ncbi:Scr1 family TA system antitoxin-like transcriptional regulator [Streptomyces sp. cg36]|uniref:Scr1 family TA system antitoxin-like transcriptional regulator n=1 Tax=Streptomyces sp. cg36 TaxID=3238798 RepID=UPI0034E26083
MTVTFPSPPVGLLVLGASLTQMRRRWGVSRALAAAAARVSAAELADGESGRAAPPQASLDRLLRLYCQPPHVHEILAGWAAAGRDEAPGHTLTDAAVGWQPRLAALEGCALRIRVFSDRAVPALVRTPAYAAGLERLRPATVLDHSSARPGQRPGVFDHHTWEHAEVILDAPVLTRRVAGAPGMPDPLADQLTHLCTVVDERRADIRIIPAATARPQRSQGSDLLQLTLPGPHRPAVWVEESSASATYRNGPPGMEQQHLLDELAARTADGAGSATLLHEAAANCTAHTLPPVQRPAHTAGPRHALASSSRRQP